jgi:hypothetical protein
MYNRDPMGNDDVYTMSGHIYKVNPVYRFSYGTCDNGFLVSVWVGRVGLDQVGQVGIDAPSPPSLQAFSITCTIRYEFWKKSMVIILFIQGTLVPTPPPPFQL